MKIHRVFAFLICGLIALTCGAADQNLSFKLDDSGNFTFDTGVVKGGLQKNGLGEGIRPIRFVESNLPIDISHGLLVPYRFLTPQRRYGFGSWEWPRTGRTGQDGSAELHWASASDRPFHFSTIYQWKAADTLDVAVVFTSETNLEKFELFLGSYFRDFTKAKVYVKDAGNDRAALVEATKDKGDMQLFPRNSDVLTIVNDGRWKFPPYPNDWSIRGGLAAPLGMRQEPRSGATVLFMAAPDDCFAISMSEQESKLGAFYLSLFGQDIKSGRTLVGHVRLVFGKNITEAQALQKYADYREDLKNNIDQALIRRAETVIPKDTSWISPSVPKPNAAGWITLFDGKQLNGCPSAAAEVESGKLSLQKDGALRLDSSLLKFNLSGSNVAIRARVKKISGQNCGLSVRNGLDGSPPTWKDCASWFSGRDFGIGKTINGRWKNFANTQSQENYNGFFEMEFRAEGENLTLKADNKMICNARDESVEKGQFGVGANKGIALFTSIQVQILDDKPTASSR